MKKLFFILFASTFFWSCNNLGKGGGWSAADQSKWMQKCSDPSVVQNLGEDGAKKYCSCMLEQLEKKYKNYDEMNTTGTYQEGVDLAKACMQGIKQGNTNNNNNGPGDPIGNVGGNNNNNNNGWTEEDKQKVMNECINHVAVNFDNSSKQKFCNCFVGKMMQKYANYSELDKNTTIEEGKQMTQDCVNELNINEGNVNNNLGTTWTNDDEQKFMNTCLKNAMNAGADRQTSTEHCSCTLKKIEKKYANYNDANQKMTAAEVRATEQECIDERNNNNQ